MNKTFGVIATSGLFAAAVAGFSSSALLEDFAKSINSAQSLSTTYLAQPIGGSSTRYTVDLQKPNLAKIDSPDQLVVADGKQITTLDKKNNTYYHEPETPEALNLLFRTDELNPWIGFFKADAYNPVSSVDKGSVTKGSATYKEVDTQYNKSGNKLVKYFLDPNDNVARQVEIDLKKDTTTDTTLLISRSFTLNGPAKPDLFTFNPPDGSKEISLADMMASKWFFNLEAAKKIAASTHRKIFVDFMATWCGPCKMLDAEVLQSEKFKEIAAKKLVLLRVDVDAQPAVASQYSVNAMPTQMILDENGNVLNKIVGYGGPEMFYSFLNQGLSQ